MTKIICPWFHNFPRNYVGITFILIAAQKIKNRENKSKSRNSKIVFPHCELPFQEKDLLYVALSLSPNACKLSLVQSL